MEIQPHTLAGNSIRQKLTPGYCWNFLLNHTSSHSYWLSALRVTSLADKNVQETWRDAAALPFRTAHNLAVAGMCRYIFLHLDTCTLYPRQIFLSLSLEIVFEMANALKLICKKGSRCTPGNYRRVCLTSIVRKVFERMVRDAMQQSVCD